MNNEEDRDQLNKEDEPKITVAAVLILFLFVVMIVLFILGAIVKSLTLIFLGILCFIPIYFIRSILNSYNKIMENVEQSFFG